jgi:hypothetical protein
MLALADSPDELVYPLGGVLECPRPAALVWRVGNYEIILADVNTNVSHNNNILNNMQHRNILEPSLQMRGQSPVNCPDSDVKKWGQNIHNCLMTNEMSALFHIYDVVNECKYKKII